MAGRRLTRDELLAAAAPEECSRRIVRLQDVDAAGIVFFARYLELFNDALFDYLERQGVAPRTLVEEAETLAPIGHASVDYLRPLRHGDRYCVAPILAVAGDERAAIGYRVWLEETGAPVAVGQTVHFGVQAGSFERSTLPEPLSRALAALPAARAN